MQARADSPSTWTVQAPHSATPQPYFVAVSPNSSRRYQSSGIDGSPSKDCTWPLTCNLTIGSPPTSVPQHTRCLPQRSCDETRAQSPLFDEGSPRPKRQVAAQIFARALTEEYRQQCCADNTFRYL